MGARIIRRERQPHLVATWALIAVLLLIAVVATP